MSYRSSLSNSRGRTIDRQAQTGLPTAPTKPTSTSSLARLTTATMLGIALISCSILAAPSPTLARQSKGPQRGQAQANRRANRGANRGQTGQRRLRVGGAQAVHAPLESLTGNLTSGVTRRRSSIQNDTSILGNAGMSNELAIAQAMFQRFDQDRDGSITRNEVPRDLQGQFDEADFNQDNRCSAQEFLNALRNQQPQPTGGQSGPAFGQNQGNPNFRTMQARTRGQGIDGQEQGNRQQAGTARRPPPRGRSGGSRGISNQNRQSAGRRR